MSKPSEKLALAADVYNRYPGEVVTYFLRFTVPEESDVTLQFAMPEVMEVESYELPDGIPPSLPRVVKVDQEMIVLIPLEKHFTAGQTYDIVARVRINTFYFNQYLITEARLVGDDGTIYAAETIQVAILGKGKYLRYLPELYESDDFTSRFLMLFESFWKPIAQQIDQVDNYFDPVMTPPEFLPWLASWIGMPIEPSLPIERMRAMLRHAILLFQCRGTSHALKTYLEIYTDGDVAIEEQRADNFVIGERDKLGENIALGTDNHPDFVRVRLRVNQAELERSGFSEATYHRKMQEIIRTMVPAHTKFEVNGVFDAQNG
jgi:phage tail-like protein